MPDLPLIPVADPDDPRALQVFWSGQANDEPISFLLDSGARRTSVPRTGALALLEPAGGTNQPSYGTAGERIDTDSAHLSRLKIGALQLDDLVVELADPARTFGLLGADVLRRHAWHFRFSERVATFGEPAPAGIFALEIEPPDGVPTVELRAGGTMVRAVWDTGAGRTVVARSWAQAHPDVVTVLDDAAAGTDAAGRPVASQAGRLGPVRIGGYDFGASDCVVVDLDGLNAQVPAPIEIILGLPLIATADWWWDFTAGAWAISRAPQPKEQP